MKTINIIVITFLVLSSPFSYAGIKDQITGCCQTSQEIASLHSQQLVLDEIQGETEEMASHHVLNHNMQLAVTNKMEQMWSMDKIQHETEELMSHHVNQNLQVAVAAKIGEASWMGDIQLETENVNMQSLTDLSETTRQHLNYSVTANK